MSTPFHSRTEETRDDWQTPAHIVHSLGQFDLDPCANALDPFRFAPAAFTEADDGLKQDWHGRVWCNPPYGAACRAWLAKLADHGNGIALVPPRLGAHWFHEVVLGTADAILFVRGRVAFINAATGKPVKGNNADSALIAWGEPNVEALECSGIDGKLWRLTAQTEPLMMGVAVL